MFSRGLAGRRKDILKELSAFVLMQCSFVSSDV